MIELIAAIDKIAADCGWPLPGHIITTERLATATVPRTRIHVIVTPEIAGKIHVESFHSAADIRVDNWHQPVIEEFRQWTTNLKLKIESAIKKAEDDKAKKKGKL